MRSSSLRVHHWNPAKIAEFPVSKRIVSNYVTMCLMDTHISNCDDLCDTSVLKSTLNFIKQYIVE